MAAIPDPRLQQLADVVKAKKVTPAGVRVVEVRGTGPALLGNLRQVDALLVVLDGFSGTRVPADDLETLKLELLVADRDQERPERHRPEARSRACRALGGGSGGVPRERRIRPRRGRAQACGDAR